MISVRSPRFPPIHSADPTNHDSNSLLAMATPIGISGRALQARLRSSGPRTQGKSSLLSIVIKISLCPFRVRETNSTARSSSPLRFNLSLWYPKRRGADNECGWIQQFRYPAEDSWDSSHVTVALDSKPGLESRPVNHRI